MLDSAAGSTCHSPRSRYNSGGRYSALGSTAITSAVPAAVSSASITTTFTATLTTSEHQSATVTD